MPETNQSPGPPVDGAEGLSLSALAAKPGRFVLRRETCPACGSGDSRLVTELRFDDAAAAPLRTPDLLAHYRFLPPLMRAFPLQILECNHCRLLWQAHVLRPEAERWWYGAIREEYSRGVRTAKWSNPTRKIRYYTGQLELASRIGPLFPERAPESLKVLDFGAGWGYLASAARALGHHVDAAEVHEAKQLHLRSLGFDCVTLPCDHRWDIVVSDQVFEHLAEPLEMLTFLCRHLGPAGCTMISVPAARRGLAAALRRHEAKALVFMFPFVHINLFTRDALLALGERAGLRPVWPQPMLTPRLDRLQGGFAANLEARARQLGKAALATVLPSLPRLFAGVQFFRLPASSGINESGKALPSSGAASPDLRSRA